MKTNRITAAAALLVSLAIALPATAASTATASIGARILAPAQSDIASGAVTITGLAPLEWTAARSGDQAKAVAMLVRGGRNAARTMSVANSAVVSNGERTLEVHGLSLEAGDPQADLGGAVAVALGGNVEIGIEARGGTYTGNVLVVTAWE